MSRAVVFVLLLVALWASSSSEAKILERHGEDVSQIEKLLDGILAKINRDSAAARSSVNEKDARRARILNALKGKVSAKNSEKVQAEAAAAKLRNEYSQLQGEQSSLESSQLVEHRKDEKERDRILDDYDKEKELIAHIKRLLHVKHFKEVGSVDSPAVDCAQIKAKRPSASSGVYYIAVNGAVMKAYCDMRTDGGGWMRVLSIHNTQNRMFTPAGSTNVAEGLDQAIHNNGAIRSDALRALPIREFRFYCKKPSVGRTVHFKTQRGNSEIINYFTGRSNHQPDTGSTVIRLSQDNSELTKHVAWWGRQNSPRRGNRCGFCNRHYCLGIYGHDTGGPTMRFHDHPFFVCSRWHWLLGHGRMECDDMGGDRRGLWRVYVR